MHPAPSRIHFNTLNLTGNRRHFAHHPDLDTTRPPCARRARDVTSADHLYVKAAAERLLRAQAMSGEVVCSPPGPELALAGSVVWLRLGDGSGLTIHMNAAVRPDRDTQPVARMVVEAKVLLDRFTLQRLPYVHRIRCDSQDTSRRVLMGTETARGTQWFTGDPCAGRPAKPAHRPTVGPRSRRTARSAGPDITRSPPPPAAPGHRTPEPRHHQHPKTDQGMRRSAGA